MIRELKNRLGQGGLRRLLGPDRFEFWQRRGYHVLRSSFYEPIPDTRSLPDDLWEPRDDLPGVDLREAEQLELLAQLAQAHGDETAVFSTTPRTDPVAPFVPNGLFSVGDAELLHTIIRHHRPRRLIELGSGMSSRVINGALARNESDGTPCSYLVVDVEPKPVLPELPTVDEVRHEPVERLPLTPFTALTAGDVLFIDTSHVVRTGGDVCFLFLEVLPQLAPGVLVHVHDVFLPDQYPRDWIVDRHHFWSEQYLLHALLVGSTAFRVLIANHFLYRRHPEALADAFPSTAPRADRGAGPSSFWIERT